MKIISCNCYKNTNLQTEIIDGKLFIPQPKGKIIFNNKKNRYEFNKTGVLYVEIKYCQFCGKKIEVKE